MSENREIEWTDHTFNKSNSAAITVMRGRVTRA
jgi:hypothetical protein